MTSTVGSEYWLDNSLSLLALTIYFHESRWTYELIEVFLTILGHDGCS